MIRSLMPEFLKRQARRSVALREWAGRGWSVPAPQVVKLEVLDRYSHGGITWIETGTWLGDTTAWLAARSAWVHSIEPEATLAANATRRFAAMDNVTIHHGTSEDRFGPIVASLSGPVAFWLDGHFSGGDTFEGSSHTPIAGELESIGKAVDRLAEVTVFVDDFRCFDPGETKFSDYPTRDHLVGWAVGHGLRWTVEHDIFIACVERFALTLATSIRCRHQGVIGLRLQKESRWWFARCWSSSVKWKRMVQWR